LGLLSLCPAPQPPGHLGAPGGFPPVRPRRSGAYLRRAGRGPLAGHPPRPTGHRPAGPGMAAGPPAVADGLGGPGTPLIPGGSPRPAAEQPDRGGPVATRRRFRVTPLASTHLTDHSLVLSHART